MTNLACRMPIIMKDLHRLNFLYANGLGIDFEPHDKFYTADETRAWIRAWTGNKAIEGNEFLVFGQDGTGGVAAFWLARSGAGVLDQPVVFFGSEGQTGVVARNFADYLWLLAGGLGPFEAVEYPTMQRAAQPSLLQYAECNAPQDRKPPTQVIAAARAEFPNFVQMIAELCS